MTELTRDESEDPLLRFQSSYLSGNNAEVIFDSGASISVTPFASDFISWEKSNSTPRLRGVSEEPTVQGVDIATFKVTTDSGEIKSLKTRAYYVPEARVRLFSTICLLYMWRKEWWILFYIIRRYKVYIS